MFILVGRFGHVKNNGFLWLKFFSRPHASPPCWLGGVAMQGGSAFPPFPHTCKDQHCGAFKNNYLMAPSQARTEKRFFLRYNFRNRIYYRNRKLKDKIKKALRRHVLIKTVNRKVKSEWRLLKFSPMNLKLRHHDIRSFTPSKNIAWQTLNYRNYEVFN